MRRPARPTLACLAALLLGACASAPRPDAWTDAFELHVAEPPSAVLERIRADADTLGWRIADIGIDSIDLDLGTAAARVVVTPEDGLAAPGANLRDTEVHCAVRFVARRAAEGTDVLVRTATAWWHPDRRVWLAAPAGLGPDRRILASAAGASFVGGPGIADAEWR
jgi:hypothetical protein